VAGLLRPVRVTAARGGKRTLALHNLHTGEFARTTYEELPTTAGQTCAQPAVVGTVTRTR
jgi:hypothetical protein